MDPPSARGSAFNHLGFAQYSTSGSANHGFAQYSTRGSAFSRIVVATDAGGKNSEVLKLGDPDQKMAPERGAGPCLDMALGNSIGREGHYQLLKKENIRISRDQVSYIMKPPSLTCYLEGGQDVNNTAKSWGKQEHMIAMQLNGPCTTLPTNHMRSSRLHRNSHKPNDLINPSLLRPPQKHLLPSLNSTLNKNDHRPHSQVANTCTKKRLFDDCEENEIPKNCLDIAESNFSSHSNSSCSFMPTQGGSDESSATGVDKTTLFDNTVGGLCYKPLEKEDCDVYLSTGEFPSTDSFLRVPITPVSVDSSMSNKKRGSVDFSSSESILRNAAMSFENMPSIIRKRRCLSSKQAASTNQKDGVCSPEKVPNTLNNQPEFPRECPNARQLPLSPPKSQKLEDFADSKYAGKRVDYASGDVSDSRNANTNTKAAADTSGGCRDLANSPDISGV